VARGLRREPQDTSREHDRRACDGELSLHDYCRFAKVLNLFSMGFVCHFLSCTFSNFLIYWCFTGTFAPRGQGFI
jgi:hypothetical protein